MLLFVYEKVIIVFLLLGHSHNAANRVVAHCRNAIRKESDDEQEASSETRAQKAKKKISRVANGMVPPVQKKVGRPKKNLVMVANQPSILTLFIKKSSLVAHPAPQCSTTVQSTSTH
ncbi:hypothetical protein AXG93_412s1420 [Marchantia polymorpha subsp. ruderalis]|uniref:Uncharacterized protein n=1 Tax=Marchantia polymorpha subsp. ruderalis TaxID=1480154 RepID=A0A176VPM2_MARPO|nr:hypothetical protein AXG93_412s1420 [Marchantia polymorpha subsp. ruderalis]